jgi:uncharacterized membrane protein YbhN (UPF0104 family)
MAPYEDSMKGTAAPTTPRWRVALRIAFVLVAAGLLVLAIGRDRAGFVTAVTALDPATIATSFGVVLLALGFNLLAWREAMRVVGVTVPLHSALKVFFLSQLGKYVPGSVWVVLAQIELTRDAGASRAKGVVGATIALVVGVVTSSILACVLLVLPDSAIRARYWWLLLIVPIAGTVLLPRVLGRIVALVFRATRRVTAVPDLSGAALARSVGWSAAVWLTLGVHSWLIASALSPGGPTLLHVTGAFAFAWVVGFLVVIAPAGLGVREAALTLALAPVMTTPDALALALVSRVLMTLGDGTAAALAALAHMRGHTRSSRSRRAG